MSLSSSIEARAYQAFPSIQASLSSDEIIACLVEQHGDSDADRVDLVWSVRRQRLKSATLLVFTNARPRVDE